MAFFYRLVRRLMPRNIEIKAHIASVDAMLARASAIADSGPTELVQDDTFFACEMGRLKLRAFSASEGELIFYKRSNQAVPKESHYVRSPTSCPSSLRDALTRAYGQAGRVQKHRTLFVAGRTRIHLDQVQGLGSFLELEVVLEDGEPIEQGTADVHKLMAQLGISQSQLIEGAYVDLLAQKAA